jgi:hypothetical protein
MKKCASCKQWKENSEFNWRFKAMGILQPSCRDCQHGHQAKYYETHKEYEKARTKKRRQRVREEAREYVYDYLSTHPCVDCGESDPVVLDFDHVKGKGSTVNNLISRGASIRRIKAEIRLTEVRCSNCHRRKTAEEGNWYKNK